MAVVAVALAFKVLSIWARPQRNRRKTRLERRMNPQDRLENINVRKQMRYSLPLDGHAKNQTCRIIQNNAK
jgi:hypothetical protein